MGIPVTLTKWLMMQHQKAEFSRLDKILISSESIFPLRREV
jgi:hypothetical protein